MNLNIELLNALFASPDFSKGVERIQSERIYRTNVGSRRYYKRKSGQTYLSLTSFLDASQTSQPFLNNWRVEMALELGRKDAVKDFVQATADYGTLLHISIANFIRIGKVMAHDVAIDAISCFNGLGWGADVVQSAVEQFCKDFAAISQFFYDHNVYVYAVEIPVWSDYLGIATCIDLIVEMDYKGQRIKAIINLKSGRNKNASHGLQLAGEKAIYNELFGDLFFPIDRVFILCPTDWEKVPNYRLSEYTSEQTEREFAATHQLAIQKGVFGLPKMPVVQFDGCFEFGKDTKDLIKITDFSNHFSIKIQSHEQQNQEKNNDTNSVI